MEQVRLKNVLVVDDEKSFLLSLLQGLSAYADDFNTYTAYNGAEALQELTKHPFDLVITDLKMPVMDGFGLLAAMSKSHPRLPVLVMSAYCTPEIKARLKTIGAFKILEKPIDFHDFVDHIIAELHTAAKGYINGITLPAFLQLVEMEKKTCTLRVESHGRSGLLYFVDGALIDAEHGEDKHEKAALTIVGWDDPMIEIDSFSKKKEPAIKSPLGYLIMESYRLKDERRKAAAGAPQSSAKQAAPGPAVRTVPEQKAAGGNGNRSAGGTQTKEGKMATTREILGELAKLPSITAVCLVARDGFLLDSIARSGIDKEMIGAIASSGFGSSESMGRQLDKGLMQISMIEFEQGPVMLSPIGEDAFLVIVADKDANLGMIRLKLKKHSGELALAAAI